MTDSSLIISTDVRHFEEDVFENVLKNGRNSKDVCKLVKFLGIENHIRPSNNDIETAIKKLNDSLSGNAPELAFPIWQAICEISAENQYHIGEFDLHILDDIGLDPATHILMALVYEFSKWNDGEPFCIFDPKSRFRINLGLAYDARKCEYANLQFRQLRLSEDVFWHNGTIITPLLPETIMQTLVGKNLKTLLLHPMTDRLDLAIKSVQPGFRRGFANSISIIETDYIAKYIPLSKIALNKISEIGEKSNKLLV